MIVWVFSYNILSKQVASSGNFEKKKKKKKPEYRYFLLVYSNVDDNAKRLKLEIIFYQKVLLRIITSLMERTFMTNQLILIWNRVQGNMVVINWTRWKLYYWMFISLRLYKNQYRLIAVDLSRQKKLDADPSAIQQVEYVEQLKKQ